MTLRATLRSYWSGASAAARTEVARLEAAPPIAAEQCEAVPHIVVERSFEGAPSSPVVAAIMGEDIAIRTINIAAAAGMQAAFIVLVRSLAVSIVAARTRGVALLPEAEAHMSPTVAAADAVGNR